MSEPASETTQAPTGRGILKHIGPGLVTACVVIGPGSILTSSNVGANNGYALGWIVLVACFFMMVYTTLAAKLGAVSQQSTCDLVQQRAGRLPAVLIGASVFFISAAFQFGNNRGVHSAVAAYVDFDALPKFFSLVPIVVFNGITLAFLFGFRNLYKLVERLMATFVALMLITFAVNLAFGRPDVGEMILGLVPLIGGEAADGASLYDRMLEQARSLDLAVMGLIGTTFVISAAFYQSYLVRFKGWKVENLKDGLLDARVSATIMALITLMLMFTAGTVLRGEELGSVGDVANALKPAFGEQGEIGRIVFCIGLFAAAYSSFLVNSMIGGFILSDALGLGSTPEDKWPRILTAAVLVTGMVVAGITILIGWDALLAIIAAQAVTVIAAPLVAGTIWWLANRSDVMGKHKNGTTANVLAGIGFLLLLGIALNTSVNSIPAKIRELREASTETSEPVEKPNDGQVTTSGTSTPGTTRDLQDPARANSFVVLDGARLFT